MARKKQHPDIGKYLARYEFQPDVDGLDEGPVLSESPDAAVAYYLEAGGPRDGEVIYVYRLHEVRRIVQTYETEAYDGEVTQ